ncbi:MAG: hypothetical protein C0167_02940 [Nitrososphaera sp.]|nr:MAG: hypothetical protein C0167_02940 [Nitrososphaera sp.]
MREAKTYFCGIHDADSGVILLTYLGVEDPERVEACRKAYELYMYVAESGLRLDEAAAAKARGVVLDICGEDALFIILAERVLGCAAMTHEEVQKMMKEKEWLRRAVVMDWAMEEAYIMERDEKGEWNKTLEI